MKVLLAQSRSVQSEHGKTFPAGVFQKLGSWRLTTEGWDVSEMPRVLSLVHSSVLSKSLLPPTHSP